MSHIRPPPSFRFPEIKFTSYIFSTSNPLKEFAVANWDVESPGKAQWIRTLKSLTDDQVIWRAAWTPQTPVLYRCGNYPWVILLGLWGSISYAPAMVRRQLGSLQFIPMTHGLKDWEFAYGVPNTADIIRRVADLWKETQRVKTGRHSNQAAPGYLSWQANRGKGLVAPKVPELSMPMELGPHTCADEAKAQCETTHQERASLVTEKKRLQKEVNLWAHRAIEVEAKCEELQKAGSIESRDEARKKAAGELEARCKQLEAQCEQLQATPMQNKTMNI